MQQHAQVLQTDVTQKKSDQRKGAYFMRNYKVQEHMQIIYFYRNHNCNCLWGYKFQLEVRKRTSKLKKCPLSFEVGTYISQSTLL